MQNINFFSKKSNRRLTYKKSTTKYLQTAMLCVNLVFGLKPGPFICSARVRYAYWGGRHEFGVQ
jgi:hypothetical protein